MRKKLRTMLTITGIAIGVFSVVLISIIGEAGKSAINEELNSLGVNGLCLRTSAEGGDPGFTRQELALVQNNRDVSEATPLITSYTSILSRGTESRAVLWGVDANASRIISLKLLHGRLINQSDINGRTRVCIVDESFARQLYKRSNIVGKTLQILSQGRYESFEIVGVVASGGNLLQGLMGDVVPSFLYAPFTTLSQLSHQDTFSQIVAKLDPAADETTATGSLLRELNLRPGRKNPVEAENLNQQKDRLNGILNQVTLILTAIGGISLGVAGLSIMTVMLVTVHERTREIGIKKSIGASSRNILAEFLTEALLLSILGSLLGTAAGILTGAAGCALAGLSLSVPAEAVIFCVVFSVAAGVLFGVYPAVQAAKLSPIEALRRE